MDQITPGQATRDAMQVIKDSGLTERHLIRLIDAMIAEHHIDMETMDAGRALFFQGRIDALRNLQACFVGINM